MSTEQQQQEQQQQNVNQVQQQNSQDQELQFNSHEEYMKDIQVKLSILFNKDNFLKNKYFITNIVNDKLCIHYNVLYKHKKFEKLLNHGPFEFEKKQIHYRNQSFFNAVKQYDQINYDEQTGLVSPKFEFERKSISVGVPTSEAQEFTQFINSCPFYKVTTVDIVESDGGQKKQTTQNIEVSFTMGRSQIVINCDSAQTAQELFKWLSEQKFKDQPISAKIEYYNYYVEAYKKIFDKYPTSYKQQNQFYQIQQQQFEYMAQMYQQMGAQYGAFNQQQGYYNNKYRNNYNNQVQNYNNGQQQQHKNYNKNYKPRNNNYNNNNKNYNNKNRGNNNNNRGGRNNNNKPQKPRSSQPAPNLEDEALFPVLGQKDQKTTTQEVQQQQEEEQKN